jgi:hypothetical protein
VNHAPSRESRATFFFFGYARHWRKKEFILVISRDLSAAAVLFLFFVMMIGSATIEK